MPPVIDDEQQQRAAPHTRPNAATMRPTNTRTIAWNRGSSAAAACAGCTASASGTRCRFTETSTAQDKIQDQKPLMRAIIGEKSVSVYSCSHISRTAGIISTAAVFCARFGGQKTHDSRLSRINIGIRVEIHVRMRYAVFCMEHVIHTIPPIVSADERNTYPRHHALAEIPRAGVLLRAPAKSLLARARARAGRTLARNLARGED